MARRWDSWLAVAGLELATAWMIFLVVDNSADAGRYYRFRHDHTGFVYPTGEVVCWCSGLLVEMLVASICILRSKSAAVACLLLAVSMGALLFAFGIFAMHAPPYVGGAIAYQLIAGAWLLVVAIISAVVRFITRPAPGTHAA